MSKRKREFAETTEQTGLNTSLPYHPLSFLIPKQYTVPFAVPYDINIPSDTIVFSQNDYNDETSRTLPVSLLDSDIWKGEDPDLKFVKFKKPFVQNKSSENTPKSQSPDPEGVYSSLTGNITPVTKSDYFKQNLKVEKPALIIPPHDDEYLFDEISKLTKSDPVEKPDDAASSQLITNSVLKQKQKPEFIYDSTVTQAVLITHLKDEFVQTISKLVESEEDNESLDLWDSYPSIMADDTNIVRLEVITSLKSKLLELISSNSIDQVNQTNFTKLLDLCVTTIKEALPIDWEMVFESEDMFSANEYQRFAEVVMNCASIIIILYSNSLVEKITKHENSFSLVVDIVCLFGAVAKSLFQCESFNELPDFFVSTLKHFGSMVSVLCSNLASLALDESSVTRFEYTAFDIIFINIVTTRERLNLNLALEELRSGFAQLIISIYSTYEDQRPFIFNEIIENFETLNPLKSKAKNFRLENGVSVQLLSYLIISLLQSHNIYGKEFDYSQYEFLTFNHPTKAKKLELQEMSDNFWNSIKYQSGSLFKAIDSFVLAFFKKILTSYSPSLRKIVENTMADFFIMLELPEFPCCGIILNAMLSSLLSICNSSENTMTSAHALFFEMIGSIASRILSLRSNSNAPLLDINIDLPSFELFTNDLLTLLSYFKFRSAGRSHSQSLFYFESLVYLAKLKKLEDSLRAIISQKNDVLLQKQLESNKKLLKSVESTIMKLMELFSQTRSQIDIESLCDQQIKEINRRITVSQEFVGRYNDILAFILSSLNHPKAKSRTLATKNLTMLISREPELIQDSNLRYMIRRRLTESYASVTDAVLDLLFKVLESKPEYINEYSDVVSQKMADTSIAVRKKTAILIKYMFLHTTSVGVKVRLAQALLNQLDDEEDRITDMSCHILCELLFINIGVEANMESDPVTIQNKAFELIYVLCGIFSLGPATWGLFERFFNEKVIYPSDFNEPFRLELKSSLKLLIESMLELITFSVDETEKMEKVSSEFIMGVISTFVKCDERLISQDQLITIQPYIINDYKGSKICFYALDVLNLALNHQKTLNRNFVQSCKESLMKRLTKFNSKELDRATQCLWKLFMLENDTVGISKACISSLKMLLKYIGELQKSSISFKSDLVLPRLLYLIGDFGRYCNFERDRELFTASKLGLLEKEPIPVFLLKYLLKFCDTSISKSLRKIAIKNTLNICISHPKLFFSVPVAKLIDSTFKKKDLEITNIVVESLLTFLENEETEMIKRNGLDVKKSGSIKLDVAVFHGYTLSYVNDGLCSTLVQKYMNNILQICLESENALSSINFLGIVIKFGFCNPKLCFPTVVSLECAKSNHIKHIALELHEFLFEKFETLIESTYSESIKTTIRYVAKFYHPYQLEHCSGFLKMFFRIVKDRNSRQRVDKFIQSILRALGIISIYKLQQMTKEELLVTQTQVIFLCINVNEMELTTQHEILKIITYIEKIILTEENIFSDQSRLLLDLFADDEDDVEKLRYLVMAKALLCLTCLTKCLMENYSITPDLILKYQESVDKKEFRTTITKSDNNQFFAGEIKNLLIGDAENQLTLLYNKIQEFAKG